MYPPPNRVAVWLAAVPRAAAAASLFLCTACAEPGTTPSSDSPGGIAASVLTTGICNGSSAPVDATCWNPGYTIAVSSPGGVHHFAISQAVDAWNDLLAPGHYTNSPLLEAQSTGGVVTVTVSGSGPEFCGTTEVDGTVRPTIVTISSSSSSACVNKNRGSLVAAIKHELAHVLGYDQTHAGGPRDAQYPFTLNCVTFLPKAFEGNFIPEGICHHEVEPIFRAYAGTVLEASFFNQPLIIGTDVYPTLVDSIAPQNTVQLSLSAWRTDDPSIANLSKGWGDHSVGSSDASRASVSSAGLVTGVAAGTAMIRLLPSTGTPTGFSMWTPFLERGDSVIVKVKPPTPLPLQVVAITFTESPVVTPGGHTATAVLSDPSATDTVHWQIISSLTPNQTTLATGPSVSFSVPASASYRLTFIASVNGFDTLQYLYVCTGTGGGGGGNQFSAPLPDAKRKTGKSGGGETDAVGGC